MCGRTAQYLLLVSVAGLTAGAPGWQDSYQDMLGDVRSRVLGKLDKMDEMKDYWGDHLETIGQHMGSRLEQFGNNFEDQMMVAKDRVSEFGSQVGDSFKNSYNRQFGSQVGDSFK